MYGCSFRSISTSGPLMNVGSEKVRKNVSKIFDLELKELKEKKLLRKPVCIESSHGPKIVINGKTYTDYSSNDYLNLSEHPAVIKAAANALKNMTLGSGASRLLSGTYTSHKLLEKRIAKFKGTQSAVLFNSGYSANTGIIPALTDKETLILSDELNHASIIDGTRISRATVKVYRHCDLEHLKLLLKKGHTDRRFKKLMVVTDTVFSMDGDIAPLDVINTLCEKYDAFLMIDEAHATGVIGDTGRGGLEYYGIRSKRIIQMGTLSKAFGCYGGFTACTKEIEELLVSRARSFIYSTSLPPALCEAGIKAIDVVEKRSKGLREKLWKNRDRLFNGLNDLGYNTLYSETPIIPVVVGSTKDALKMAKRLYREMIFVPAIRPPTVTEGKCRLRFSVTSGHTNEDIDHALEILSK